MATGEARRQLYQALRIRKANYRSPTACGPAVPAGARSLLVSTLRSSTPLRFKTR
jgi:ribosomal protein L32E